MRALLVDDHHLFRQGLKFLLADLEQGITFLEADSSAQALAMAGGEPVDLVLLDLKMPGADGMAALDAIRAAFESSVLVVLSSEDDPRVIRQAIDTGAAGFVPKSSTPQVLVAALRLVLAGGVYLPLDVLRAASGGRGAGELDELDERAEAALPPARIDGLSERQREVLLKAVQGKANKVIARELNLSEGTIKAHLSAAFRTLGVQNRTEAVFAAAKVGLTAHEPALNQL